ncbi:MAG: hypothetical protein IPO58_26675 [Betaproteobacteria bacterium]|nr:hypothetical protein [Betaproteobacteria bacterium]
MRADARGICRYRRRLRLARALDGPETLPYKKDRLVLAVPFDHPLAVVPCIQFADALDYDFIGPGFPTARRTRS